MDSWDVAQDLRDLAELHSAGALSDEEFASAKREVIASSGAASPGGPDEAPAHEDQARPGALPTPRAHAETSVPVRTGRTAPDPLAPPASSSRTPPTGAPLHVP